MVALQVWSDRRASVRQRTYYLVSEDQPLMCGAWYSDLVSGRCPVHCEPTYVTSWVFD